MTNILIQIIINWFQKDEKLFLSKILFGFKVFWFLLNLGNVCVLLKW